MTAVADLKRPHRATWAVPIVLATFAVLLLAAAPASAAVEAFPNTTPIELSGGGVGAASPYPSPVSVSGVAGPITDVNVTFHRVGHAAPHLIKALLVSPGGDKVNLMNSNCGPDDIEDYTWILDQQHATPMSRGGPSCPDFVYRPNAFASTVALPAPAPAGPYKTSLDAFNGENPNGTWRLYVAETADGNSGDMEQGWTLTLSTRTADTLVPAGGTSGAANPYPAPRRVSGETGVITDLDVTLDGVWHQNPDDLDLLLVGPHGQSSVLMSESCGTYEMAAYGFVWDDEAPGFMPDGDATDACNATRYRPTNRSTVDSWPSPAPAGPHGSALSVFDHTDPNGEWRLYVYDDSSDKVGFFTNRFRLILATRPKAKVAFTDSAVTLREGEARQLTLRRSGPSPVGAGEVKVASMPVSASSPGDYTAVSETVQFAAGQTEKTVRIDARADGVEEPDEAYAVAISSATGDAAIDSPSSVAVTIPGPAAAQAGGGTTCRADGSARVSPACQSSPSAWKRSSACSSRPESSCTTPNARRWNGSR